jgi:hypothetical protein
VADVDAELTGGLEAVEGGLECPDVRAAHAERTTATLIATIERAI